MSYKNKKKHYRHTPIFYMKDNFHYPNGTLLGFWIYLMSDCILFAILFAVYGVLGRNYAQGPIPTDIFNLKLIALNTIILLLSSLSYGLSNICMLHNQLYKTQFWLGITGILGIIFISLECYEFYHLSHIGANITVSAFLASFYALVSTHGLHVFFGILWIIILMIKISIEGLNHENKRGLMCLSMFWHFLDIIWIGVFSIVYLLGTIIV